MSVILNEQRRLTLSVVIATCIGIWASHWLRFIR